MRPLCFMTWNARSLNNKADDTMALIQDLSVDVAFVTETWLTELCSVTTACIKSYGYGITHNFRSDRRGGGTAIIYKSSLSTSTVSLGVSDIYTFGYTCMQLKCCSDVKVLAICLYRTGPVIELFFTELNDLLQAASLRSDYVILCGDFNIHVEQPSSREVVKLLQVTESFSYCQIVSNPTHLHGGTIDLVFDNSNLIDLQSVTVHDYLNISDHFPVVFQTKSLAVNPKIAKTIQTRCLKEIDHAILSEDLIQCLETFRSECDESEDFLNSFTCYSATVSTVIDNHAPLTTKTISYNPSAPWFDAEYKKQRVLKRKAEAKLRNNICDENQCSYNTVKRETTALAKLKKQQYYTRKIDNAKGNMRAIYQIASREMDRTKTVVLPECDDTAKLAAEFNNFFIEKIQKIRDTFPENNSSFNRKQQHYGGDVLSSFLPCTIDEIREIVAESGVKCSPSDFIPTELLKKHIETFLPSLCTLVNLSLKTGSMDGLKVADIVPSLKNDKLDHQEYKNYRPISNLTFLGKLVERVVLRRLNDHMKHNNLEIPEQSAYKKHHSTETILVKITNDLLLASDNRSGTVLMMLDLSAAFDTVDHRKLLSILRREIGISGIALTWFESFLGGRCQRVRLGETLSEDIILMFGVPQGSVLGPVLFNIYVRSLYSVVKKCGFMVQGYADDHQIYKSFKPDQQSEVLTYEIKECFLRIQDWMMEYCLQLNPNKTEIIVFGSPAIVEEITIMGVMLTNNNCIRFSKVVKNLGVYIDNNLTFVDQVKTLKKTSFKTLRNIRKLRYLFDEEQLKLIVNSLIVCKLDYCNSLYYGANQKVIQELQLIQNAAAKVIYGFYKHDHLGDSLQSLHWLPVKYRIQFKLLLIVYKTLTGQGPQYLEELLQYKSFNNVPLLNTDRSASSWGERAFSHAGPTLWNKLPPSVKSATTVDVFKTNLKTFLFQKAFEIE